MREDWKWLPFEYKPISPGTVEVAVPGPTGGIFYKRVEAMPGGGFRVDGRLLQWQQVGAEGGRTVSPRQTLINALRAAGESMRDVTIDPWTTQATYQRAGQGGFEQYTEKFPGIPVNWRDKIATVAGGPKRLWYQWAPAFQARMFTGLQIRTHPGEYRDPGAWESYRFPRRAGPYVSRGAESRGEYGRYGRWLAFPLGAERASTESFVGGTPEEPVFQAGFTARQAAKRWQLGAQEAFPLEDIPISTSPFRLPPVPQPGGGLLPISRGRGQAIKAAILMTGFLPEGMAQVDLPPTFHEKIQRTLIPGTRTGRPGEVAAGTIGATAERYGKLTLGYTSAGVPITYDVGDWQHAELMEQEVQRYEGRTSLLSRIRMRVPTSGTTSHKSAVKAYEIGGTLPQQLGVQAVYPAWKNVVGAAHNILAGVKALEPDEWARLSTQFNLPQDWSMAGAERIMAAAQSYAAAHMEMPTIRVAMHESLFPGQQLQLRAGQVSPAQGFVGELLGATSLGEQRWMLTMKKPMYVGSWWRQGRREYAGRQPFLSFEELRQVQEFVSPSFARQLRRQGTQVTGPYQEMWRAWESRPEAQRTMPGQRPVGVSPTAEQWERAVARSRDLPEEEGDPTRRWLQAMAETIGGKPISFGASVLGKPYTFTLPSPKDVLSFKALSELGEEVAPITTSYARLTEMLAGGVADRPLLRQLNKFTRAYRGLVGSPEFQRQLAGTVPRHAAEGPMASDLALAPRETVFGREALAQMAGLSLGANLDEAALESFMRTVEQRYRSGDPLIALLARRPISDPKGQWSMVATKVMTEALGAEKQVSARDLGRSAVASPFIAAAGHGDWDVDRYLALLAYKGKARYVPDIKEAPGQAFRTPLTFPGSIRGIFGQLRMFRPGGTEQGGWDIKTPRWARRMVAQDLPAQLGQRIAELAGGAPDPWREDVWWNEMGKWAKEQRDVTRMQSVAKEGGWYGSLRSFTGREAQQSYINEMLNKAIGMTAPYNIGRALEMVGADRESTMAFTAVAYQYGLDKLFGLEKGQGPEGLKTLLEMWGSYTPQYPNRRGSAGWYQKLHGYVPRNLRGGGQRLQPEYQTSTGGPAGLVADILTAMGGLSGELTPEHIAGLIYGPKWGGAELQAVQSGSADLMMMAGGGAWDLMQKPGIVQAIAARRIGAAAAKGWAPMGGPRDPWAAGPWKDLASLGQVISSTTSFVSGGQGVPDIAQALWDMPEQYGGWLREDILSRSGMPMEDPAAWLRSIGLNIPSFQRGGAVRAGMPWQEVLATVQPYEMMIPQEQQTALYAALKAVQGTGVLDAQNEAIINDIIAKIPTKKPPTGPSQVSQSTRVPGTGGGYAIGGTPTPPTPPGGGGGGFNININRYGAMGGNINPAAFTQSFLDAMLQHDALLEQQRLATRYLKNVNKQRPELGYNQFLTAWEASVAGWPSMAAGMMAEQFGIEQSSTIFNRMADIAQLQFEGKSLADYSSSELNRRQRGLVRIAGWLEKRNLPIPESITQMRMAGMAERLARRAGPGVLEQRAWGGAMMGWQSQGDIVAAEAFGLRHGASMRSHLKRVADVWGAGGVEALDLSKVSELNYSLMQLKEAGGLGQIPGFEEFASRAQVREAQLRTAARPKSVPEQFEAARLQREAVSDQERLKALGIGTYKPKDIEAEIDRSAREFTRDMDDTAKVMRDAKKGFEELAKLDTEQRAEKFTTVLAEATERAQNFRQWARDIMEGRGAERAMGGIERQLAKGQPLTPSQMVQYGAMMDLSPRGRRAGEAAGPMGARLQAAGERMAEIEARAAVQAGGMPWTERVARGLHEFTSGWELMRLQRMWHLTGGPVFEQMIPSAAQAGMVGWQAAMGVGGYAPGMPGGVAGGVMGFQAAQRQAITEAGRVGYAAWGWTQQPAGGWQQARAFMGPAVGAGLVLGGIGTSAAAILGNMEWNKASAKAGLPITLGVTGLTTAISAGMYALGVTEGTAENALRAFRQQETGDRWGLFVSKMGYKLRTGDYPEAKEALSAQIALGQQLATTPMAQLGAREQAAALGYAAQQLTTMPGTIWQGMDETQIMTVLGQTAAYSNIGRLSAQQIVAQGGGPLAQMAAAVGHGPERYEALTAQYREGGQFTARMFQDLARLPEAQRMVKEAALQQYAPMMMFGKSPEQIYTSVMGKRVGLGDLAQFLEPEWQRLTGQQAQALEMGYTAAQQYAAVRGLPTTAPQVQQFMGQMRQLAIDNATIQINNASIAAQYAEPITRQEGPVAGAQAMTAYYNMLNQGVSQTAIQYIQQMQLGGGLVGAAAGIPEGMRAQIEAPFAFALASGNITAGQYRRIAGQVGFAGSQLGYSMLAEGGALGYGALQQQLRGTFEQWGLPLPAGGGFYERGPGGLYPFGQQAQMARAWQQTIAQQQRTMGTGTYATQTIDVGAGPETFQMGLLGDIAMQRRHLANFQQMRGLQSQLFEAQQAGQMSSIAYAMASAQMQYRQAMEAMGLRQAMWGAQTGYERQEMGFQWQQMMQARAWGREDFAFNRQVAGLQYGWQMEDLNRAIRFATGREKESLIRQRERAEEMYGIQEGRRGKEEERQEILWQQEEEQFARRRAHFEEIKALEAEQFEMQKRHLTESFNLQMQHLQEQADRAAGIAEIQREITKLSQDQTEEDMKYRIAQAEQTRDYYEKDVFPNQLKELQMNQLIAKKHAEYADWQMSLITDGGLIWKTVENFVNQVELWFLRLLGGLVGGKGGDVKKGSSGSTAAGYMTCPACGESIPAGSIRCPYCGAQIRGSYGDYAATIDQALTGRIVRPATVSVGNIVINIPPGNYGSPQEVAAAVREEFERSINSLAERQRLRGGTW